MRFLTVFATMQLKLNERKITDQVDGNPVKTIFIFRYHSSEGRRKEHVPAIVLQTLTPELTGTYIFGIMSVGSNPTLAIQWPI